MLHNNYIFKISIIKPPKKLAGGRGGALHTLVRHFGGVKVHCQFPVFAFGGRAWGVCQSGGLFGRALKFLCADWWGRFVGGGGCCGCRVGGFCVFRSSGVPKVWPCFLALPTRNSFLSHLAEKKQNIINWISDKVYKFACYQIKTLFYLVIFL